MSIITAKTIVFYKGDVKHKPIEKEMPLLGVDSLFKGVAFPRTGITFLYGHRNPAVPYFLEHAAGLKLDAAEVDVQVDIGRWIRQKVDLSDNESRGLRHIHFLSLVRVRREVASVIEKLWVRELGEEVASREGFPLTGTRYPQLFDALIKMPEFSHLTAIAYHASTAEVGDVQVVTIFNQDAIIGYRADHNLQDVELIL